MSQDFDSIEELFRSKLADAPTPVDSAVWTSIQSKMAANSIASTAAKKGLSGLTKGIILSTSIAGIGIVTWFAVQSNENTVQNKSALVVVNEQKEDYSSVENEEIIGLVSEDNLNENTITKEKLNFSSVNKDKKGASSEVKVKPLVKVPVLKEEAYFVATDHYIPAPTPVIEREDLKEKTITVPVQKEVKSIENKTINAGAEVINTVPIVVNKTEFIRLPNVYHLNNSGYFSVEYKGDFKDFSISILDEKQQVIFRSEDPNFKWFGDDLFGQKVDAGAFFYLIVATDQQGNRTQKYQSLTIIP